jgi:ferric-dicitrate binding protein FerR (iron transport regulator)
MPQKTKIYPLLRAAGVAVVLFAILWCGYLIKQQNEHTTFVSARTGVGEVRKLSFPDGSSVWMNANSSLRYAKYFPQFRKILLDEGEIFCEVRHDKSSPFSVTTSTGLTINDIGTSFLVKSYGALNEEQVSVLEGEVEVKNLHLRKGRGIRFQQSGTENYIVNPAETDWRTGRVVLYNVDLRSFLLTLENTYGVTIRVKDATLMNCHITTSFNTSEKIRNILDNLQRIYCISYIINKHEIVLDCQ